MPDYQKLFLGAVILTLAAGSAAAQTSPAGDNDDQFVITGCVMPAHQAVRPNRIR